MKLERELREQLFGRIVSSVTTNQMRKNDLVNKMVNSILLLLSQTNDCPFYPIPNHLHLVNMLSLYEKWKEFVHCYNEVDTHIDKKITGYLLKVSHYWWINDRTLLRKIITHYVNSHYHYREIIYGIIDNCATWKTLFDWEYWLPPSREPLVAGDNSPLVYCLGRYNFDEVLMCERSFDNEPCLLITRCMSGPQECFEEVMPEKLLLLLQYGLSISGINDVEMESYTCVLMLHEILYSLLIYLASIENKRSEERYAFVTSNEYWKKKILCGKIIMRAAPQVTMYRQLKVDCEEMVRIAITWKLSDYFPEIAKLKDPCRLKHLCRIVVRSIMKYKELLPDGVKKLTLPSSLKDYLNLLED